MTNPPPAVQRISFASSLEFSFTVPKFEGIVKGWALFGLRNFHSKLMSQSCSVVEDIIDTALDEEEVGFSAPPKRIDSRIRLKFLLTLKQHYTFKTLRFFHMQRGPRGKK